MRQPGVVWSTIGATSPPTSEKSGHNNNLPVIVTGDCVDVVNAGDNDLLARALHEEVKQITDEPVKYVGLDNGPGHAMLGAEIVHTRSRRSLVHGRDDQVQQGLLGLNARADPPDHRRS